MKKIFQFGLLFFFSQILIFSLNSCKNDKLPEPQIPNFCDSISATYTDSVKSIIDSKCSVSGCHLNAQGPLLNNYTEVFGNAQRISARALDQKTMPPAGMPQLTNEEIEILSCWREAGFPEN